MLRRAIAGLARAAISPPGRALASPGPSSGCAAALGYHTSTFARRTPGADVSRWPTGVLGCLAVDNSPAAAAAAAAAGGPSRSGLLQSALSPRHSSQGHHIKPSSIELKCRPMTGGFFQPGCTRRAATAAAAGAAAAPSLLRHSRGYAVRRLMKPAEPEEPKRVGPQHRVGDKILAKQVRLVLSSGREEDDEAGGLMSENNDSNAERSTIYLQGGCYYRRTRLGSWWSTPDRRTSMCTYPRPDCGFSSIQRRSSRCFQ